MSDTSRKLERLKRSSDDKLLEKQGIVDSDGELTEEGHRVVSEKAFVVYRDEILADLNTIVETEKKDRGNS